MQVGMVFGLLQLVFDEMVLLWNECLYWCFGFSFEVVVCVGDVMSGRDFFIVVIGDGYQFEIFFFYRSVYVCFLYLFVC